MCILVHVGKSVSIDCTLELGEGRGAERWREHRASAGIVGPSPQYWRDVRQLVK